ncbi:hypothetical protein PHPALM_29511 [Phytophthora palmivora]|uniref:Uncharacterized protein n=1 Tax=Phytophthora palmivora TaxID=4796 RepID=A0A2P4X7D5_9STRA|nr:hypothetical protein PHPALM_29511 [Phytophthora palmivora]
MTASYALPDLETAIQQDVLNATFTAVDDGSDEDEYYFYSVMVFSQMISISTSENASVRMILLQLEQRFLTQFIGMTASSRLHISKSDDSENKRQKTYGSRGAFLFELVSLATSVEIESRVYEHWTSYRKVFQEGEVVFNARSKQLQNSGTKLSASNLFGKLPVRRKDLSRSIKHRMRVIQNIRNFCVSMSMIWPSLSIDIRFQGLC